MWPPRPRRNSMEIDPCTFFSLLGRVAGQSLVMGFPGASPDAEDPNNQVVKPYHRGKYREPNRDKWRGIAHCFILLQRKLWVERVLGNGLGVHSHDNILQQKLSSARHRDNTKDLGAYAPQGITMQRGRRLRGHSPMCREPQKETRTRKSTATVLRDTSPSSKERGRERSRRTCTRHVNDSTLFGSDGASWQLTRNSNT